MESFLEKRELNFNKFVIDYLQPTRESNDRVKQIIDSVKSFVQHNTGYKIQRVVKAGSFGKGTHVKNKFDLDLVVFLNDFKSMSDFRKKVDQVLDNLEMLLKNWQPEKVLATKVTKHSVKLNLRYSLENDSYLGIDLLPAYDILGHKRDPGIVYDEMEQESLENREFYSVTLTELQRSFVKTKPAKLKNLIRLVKFWGKTHLKTLDGNSFDSRFPKSYFLELVTIDAWEKAGSFGRLDYAQGFKAVMGLLSHPHAINISWKTNYLNKIMVDAIPNLPYVLDPANPFNNVAEGFEDTLIKISEIAAKSFNAPALQKVVVGRPNWGTNKKRSRKSKRNI